MQKPLAGRHKGRKADSQKGRRADRGQKGWEKHGRHAGGQECRRAGMQADRRMYRKTNVQIVIHVHTYRNKDGQTYTDEQTDRQCRSAGRQAEKHTDVQKDDCILKDRQTDRQTDRQNRQAQNGRSMAGMQEGRNAGGQECRQTDGCTVRQMYK